MLSDHPYMRLDRNEYAFDMLPFANDLAQALGWQTGEMDAGFHVIGRLSNGPLSIYMHAGRGANKGRVEIGINAPDLQRRSDRHFTWPKLTVDAARPMADIAKAVQRRVIDAAAPVLAALEAHVAKSLNARAQCDAIGAAIRAAYPFARIEFKDDNAAQASFYMSDTTDAGSTLYGRLNADGSLYVDRLGTVPPERLNAVLAALFGPIA